jgi:hypothetical protein
LKTNNIDANVLVTSSLTTADITLAGGSMRVGSPPTNGVLLNSAGLRGYNPGVSGGVSFAIDSGGTASFTGGITSSAITGGTVTGANVQTTTGTLGFSDGGFFAKTSGAFANANGIRWIDSGTGADVVRLWSASTLTYLQQTVNGSLSIASDNIFIGDRASTTQLQVYPASVYINSANLFCNVGLYTDTFGPRFATKITTGSLFLTGSDQMQINKSYQNGGYATKGLYITSPTNGEGAGLGLVNNGSATGVIMHEYQGYCDIRTSDNAGYANFRAIVLNQSSMHLKEAVETFAPAGCQLLARIRPVNFKYNKDNAPGDDELHLGVIAEEAYEVLPELSPLDPEGSPTSVDSMAFVALLVKGVQELDQRVKVLEGSNGV